MLTLAQWTIDDYHQMIQTGLLVDRRVELLQGLVVEMAPEGPEHAEVSTDADEWFTAQAQGRYRVRVAKPITLAPDASEPEPDLALVRPQSYRQSHPTAADLFLVVELSQTTLTKDTGAKRQIYARAAIPEYWVVNLQDRTLIVYRQPQEGDYQQVETYRQGEVALLAFPDVVVPVARFVSA
jgi:Uma2 family endonuclease